ncbi:MAG: hypothetical protein ACOYEV_10910 [Candidatus Nanopelagicales bacterium]
MINIAVEGESDREAAKAVVQFAGHAVGKIVVAGGCTRLDPKISSYRKAARDVSWVVFRDSDGECALALRQRLLRNDSTVNARFALRIARTMTEAWLIADRAGFARFFGVAPSDVPPTPEALPHAKRTLLQLCAKSKQRSIRQDAVYRDGHAGPLYVKLINDFASTIWNVDAAAGSSQSLARAVAAIRALP